MQVRPASGHEVLVEDLGKEGVGEAITHGQGPIGQLLFSLGLEETVQPCELREPLLQGLLAPVEK